MRIFILIFGIVFLSALVTESFAQTYFVKEMDFGGKPTSGIVDEKSDTVYITDFFGGKLYVVDGKTDILLDTIEELNSPFGVGVNPETGILYVGGELANTLYVIDSKTKETVTTLSLRDPYDIAVNHNNNMVYVTSDRSDTVFVIDGSTNRVIDSFEVKVPCGIAVNSETGMVYVTSESEDVVHVYDGNTNQSVTTIPVGSHPRGVYVNLDTNKVYVTNQESDSVSVIDGNTNEVIGSIPVGDAPRRIVVDPDSDTLYVTNQGSWDLSVIDGKTNQVIETVPVTEPFELAINSKTDKVYAMYYGSTLSVISQSDFLGSLKEQLLQGMDPHNVTCRDGLELVFKSTTLEPACVKPSSVQKLVDRGWATLDIVN